MNVNGLPAFELTINLKIHKQFTVNELATAEIDLTGNLEEAIARAIAARDLLNIATAKGALKRG